MIYFLILCVQINLFHSHSHSHMVRVHGSGRATLRNRKFLRRYTPIQPSNEYAYNLDKLRFTTPQLTSTETPPARPSPTGTPKVVEPADTTTIYLINIYNKYFLILFIFRICIYEDRHVFTTSCCMFMLESSVTPRILTDLLGCMISLPTFKERWLY